MATAWLHLLELLQREDAVVVDVPRTEERHDLLPHGLVDLWGVTARNGPLDLWGVTARNGPVAGGVDKGPTRTDGRMPVVWRMLVLRRARGQLEICHHVGAMWLRRECHVAATWSHGCHVVVRLPRGRTTATWSHGCHVVARLPRGRAAACWYSLSMAATATSTSMTERPASS